MKGLVTSVLDGFSACIFAYGQTGSGKTFTMEGEDGEQAGMIPRTLETLCEEMAQHPEIRYAVAIRMIEIYNEKVYDLLGGNTQVEARLDASGRVVFPSAVVEEAKSLAQMLEILKKASGIITSQAGQNSHAAVVGLTLNIPVIVGAKDCTQIIRNGATVLMDAGKGIVCNVVGQN